MGTDNDAKENARLKFRLVTSSGSFKLDANTGELTTLHSLDREKQSQYELIAMLMDHGRPTRSATAKILIYVSDVNDHDPIVVFPAFGRGNVTVSFREPPGEVSTKCTITMIVAQVNFTHINSLHSERINRYAIVFSCNAVNIIGD